MLNLADLFSKFESVYDIINIRNYGKLLQKFITQFQLEIKILSFQASG